MSLTVDIQCASAEPVPDEDYLRSWIAAALASQNTPGDTEISLRLVGIEEMAKHNEAYRGVAGPTNGAVYNYFPGLAIQILNDF